MRQKGMPEYRQSNLCVHFMPTPGTYNWAEEHAARKLGKSHRSQSGNSSNDCTVILNSGPYIVRPPVQILRLHTYQHLIHSMKWDNR